MSYSSEVLADSPLAYYRLGEASGTAMVDSSGNGRDGSYVNGPTLGAAGSLAGDSDTAVTLSGADQFGAVPFASWQNVSSMTVEAWIKTSSTDVRSIVDRDQGANRVFQFRISAGKFQFLRLKATNGTLSVVTASSGVSVNDDTWHHVVATFSDTTIRLFVDGVEDGTATASGGLFMPATQGLFVGINNVADGGTAGAADFAGSIDEVAYYGAALSGARIAAHYAAATVAPDSTGALTLTLPVPTVALAGTYADPTPAGQLAATLPTPIVSFGGTYSGPIAGTLDASLPLPTMALSGTYTGEAPAPAEVVRNGFGLWLDSSATVNVVAPLDASSLSTTVPLHIVAATVPVPTLVAGRPQ